MNKGFFIECFGPMMLVISAMLIAWWMITKYEERFDAWLKAYAAISAIILAVFIAAVWVKTVVWKRLADIPVGSPATGASGPIYGNVIYTNVPNCGCFSQGRHDGYGNLIITNANGTTHTIIGGAR